MSNSSVILITGTSKGIGLYLAQTYSKRGHAVIGCSRQAQAFKSPHYHHVQLDITHEPQVKELFQDIKTRYGRLDVLINNAGIASMNHSLLTPTHTAQAMLNTNVLGTFQMSREAAKVMQQNKFGRIVNLTSIAVPLKLAGESMYAASKAAVISLTQILAKELSPFGITVNAIGPTPIKTDLIAGVPKKKLEQLIAQQAIPRYGTVEDVINVIDFFIQPHSHFITGQVLYLGGI